MISLTARLGPEFSRSVLPPEKTGPLGEGARLPSGVQSFIQELTAPVSLGSFAAGITLGRLATAGVLLHSTRWTRAALLGSQAAGLAAEIGGMTLTRRLGAQVFLGDSNPWQVSDLAHEMLLMAGPFALLRGSHLLLAGWRCAGASALTDIAQLGGDVLAVMAGQGFNRLLGLESAAAQDSPSFYSALLTVAHMRLAGQILAPFAPRTLDQAIRLHEIRLKAAEKISHGEGPDLPWGSAPWAPAEAVGSTGLTRPSWSAEYQTRMVGEKSGTSAKPKTGDSAPPSSDREVAIQAELESRMRELQKEAARFSLGENLEGVAQRLQGLLDRYLAGDVSRPSDFERELAQIEEQIQQVKAKKTRLGEIMDNLRVFLDQVRTPETKREPSSPKATMMAQDSAQSGPPLIGGTVGDLVLGIRDGLKGLINRIRRKVPNYSGEDPAVVDEPRIAETEERIRVIREKLDAKEDQGTRLQEVLRNLESLRRYLLVANRRGLEDRILWNMNARIAKLRESFPGLMWRTIPWKQAGGALAERRNGAIVGLGMLTPGMEFDTTLARRLRSDSAEQGRETKLDRELEVMQQSILLGAGWQGSQRRMRHHLDRILADYGVTNQAEIPNRLAAETTYQLVMGKITADQVMESLLSRTSGGPLENAVKGLHTVLKLPGETAHSLTFLTREAALENLLLSSLGVMLRSSGKSDVLVDELKQLAEMDAPGFHPSLALAFFGAAHGHQKLPPAFLPKEFDQEGYLRRAQEEFLREFGDPS